MQLCLLSHSKNIKIVYNKNFHFQPWWINYKTWSFSLKQSENWIVYTIQFSKHYRTVLCERRELTEWVPAFARRGHRARWSHWTEVTERGLSKVKAAWIYQSWGKGRDAGDEAQETVLMITPYKKKKKEKEKNCLSTKLNIL